MRRPSPSRRLDRDAGEFEHLFGLHTVLAALANPRRRIRRVWATRNVADRHQAEFACAGIAPEIVAPAEIERRLGAETVHQGLAADAEPVPQPALEDLAAEGIVVLLDQVTDPHNVGAILRSCAAFGVAALITTWRYSPASTGVMAKAASGALEQVPYVRVVNLARALAALKHKGFAVIGLDAAAEVSLDRLAPAPPVALVLGAEGKGLRQLTRASCHHLARLALPGRLASLNVSNAAAVALYAVAAAARKDQ